MCYYDQYIYLCGDWKWGNLRGHCDSDYRMVKTCRMKTSYQRIELLEKCKLCLEIEAKERRKAKHVADHARWSRDPRRYQAKIEVVLQDINALEKVIASLESKRSDRGFSSRAWKTSELSPSIVPSVAPLQPTATEATEPRSIEQEEHPGIISSVTEGRTFHDDATLYQSDSIQSSKLDSTVLGIAQEPCGPWEQGFHSRDQLPIPELTQGLHHDGNFSKKRRARSRSSSNHSQASSTLSQTSLAFSQFSMASSATSLASSVSGQQSALVDNIAQALFCTRELELILDSAFRDPDVGVERLKNNIRRMIQQFGSDLRAEVADKLQLDISRAMKSWRLSSYAANSVIRHAQVACSKSSAAGRSQLDSDDDDAPAVTSDGSSDSLGEDDEKELSSTEFHEIQDFLLNSAAYGVFKTDLFNFVHKPYEKRVLRAIGDNLVGQAGEHLDRSALKSLARELSWVPPQLFMFSSRVNPSYSNDIKAFVEDQMGETWNWSPLAARRYSLQADSCRLSWKSPSGRARHVDLPEEIEGAVQDAFDTAPRFLNQVDHCNSHTALAMGDCLAGAPSNSLITVPSSSYQAGASGASSFQAGPYMPLQHVGAPAPSVTSGPQLCGQSAYAQQDSHHVYLCVEAGSREFVGLNCAGIHTDIQFFDRIKSEYNSARGWFRLWFSTWRYDHCEFMQFQKVGIGLSARLKIAFPEPTDPLYHYMPKPLESLQLPPHGPISPDEFRLHYYYQVCPSLLSWERWHRRRTGLSLVEKEAFEVAPKRVVKLDMQNGRREKSTGYMRRKHAVPCALRSTCRFAACRE